MTGPGWGELRRQWSYLSAYERFEAVVTLALRAVLAAVILVALYRLVINVIETLVVRSRDPLEHTVFQAVFGGIMTLLIALEFNHTIQYTPVHDHGIIHVRTVILIAQLALARRVIVVEFGDAEPASLAALALLMLSLGVTSWLLREPADTESRAEAPRPPAA